MDDIHAQIQTTQTEITDILNAMDEKRDLQYQDIMDAINKAVASINTEIQSAHANLEALILQLKADGEADHAETLETLLGMESSLAESMSRNLDQINNSFTDLNASLAQYFAQLKEEQGAGQEELGNAIGELGNNLKENQQVIRDELAAHDRNNTQGQNEIKDAIRNHDANMLAGQEGLNSAIGAHNENVRGYIDSLKSFFAEKLDQVFTYVSNGKKRLASALLTKGVNIREDATFAEFAQAILNIPQKLVIGVQEIPGEIEYEYHYHTDASGNWVGEVETNDVQGGCYTVAVYHTHGDGCYEWKHEHNEHCKSHPVWVDWHPDYPDGYWGAIYDCGDQPANVRGDLICSLPTSSDGQPIYYALGCGLADGQIVAAHIVYNQNSGRIAGEKWVKQTDSQKIRAAGVVNEPEYPVPIETESVRETEEDVLSTEPEEADAEEAEEISEPESTQAWEDADETEESDMETAADVVESQKQEDIDRMQSDTAEEEFTMQETTAEEEEAGTVSVTEESMQESVEVE